MDKFIKKKVETEMSLYFPSLIDTTAVIEYFSLLKKHTLTKLGVLTGVSDEKDLRTIEIDMYNLQPTKVFQGKKSVEIKAEKDFIELQNVVKTHIPNSEPKTMSVMEFYTTLESIKKQSSKNG